jgi:RNA polymerase sigma factor (sigma-70 family)
VRNPQDAEEAFQLTMLAAYRALSAGRGPRATLRPWLFRIAHNECVDLLRGRPPVEELTDRHPMAELLHERIEAREALRQLSDDIAALPLRQRAAFVLHEFNGLPHAAVGEALGTTPLGARQLLHEARTSLEEFHAGRALACDEVRIRIGAGDRRILRGRGISAHLRGCAACRDVRAAAQAPPRRSRRLLVAAAAAAVVVAAMVAIGVHSLSAAPAAGDPSAAPRAATPAPLTAPPPGTAPAAPATAPSDPPPAAPAPEPSKAAAPPPAPPAGEPDAPAPQVRVARSDPPPAATPPPAPAPAATPVVTVDPSTGEPSALAAAPQAAPPPAPGNKPGEPAPPGEPSPSGPRPAPEPAGEEIPDEPSEAPTPSAPEAAPAPADGPEALVSEPAPD